MPGRHCRADPQDGSLCGLRAGASTRTLLPCPMPVQELLVTAVRGHVTAGRERRRGGLRAEWPGWVVFAAALLGFALVLAGWLAGGVAFSLPWAPTLDLRLSFALDG